jgi:hypothetical protein
MIEKHRFFCVHISPNVSTRKIRQPLEGKVLKGSLARDLSFQVLFTNQFLLGP